MENKYPTRFVALFVAFCETVHNHQIFCSKRGHPPEILFVPLRVRNHFPHFPQKNRERLRRSRIALHTVVPSGADVRVQRVAEKRPGKVLFSITYFTLIHCWLTQRKGRGWDDD